VILDSGSGGCSSSDSTFDEAIRIISKLEVPDFDAHLILCEQQ